MGMTKVGHSTRLYRALQALASPSPSLPQRSSATTIHSKQ